LILVLNVVGNMVRISKEESRMRKALVLSVLVGLAAGLPALAQQTGTIAGEVTLPDGSPIEGVTVEAASEVLPRPRVTTTQANGEYSLPGLPPGDYTITFTMDGMGSFTREVQVLLQQQTTLSATMGPEAIEEEITVISETPLIDPSSAAIKSAFASDVIEQVPVGQEYRDLQKLIPGVVYTELTIRGPSAGGSGQDNVYQFDGVNVGLPLFGTLSAEPSSNDIEQVAVVKGGATATDFNRSGGFTIDSLSKSGTNEYHGTVGYQIQTEDMTSDRDTGVATEFERDRDWATLSFGGPAIREHLLFYGSYYRPTDKGESRSNLYGPVPDYDSERDELFGKLTWTPTAAVLVNGSYRDSDREVTGASVLGEDDAASTSVNEEATLGIIIVEGSWVPNANSFASFKFTDFENETGGVPATVLGFDARTDGSLDLDIANLENQGLFEVPTSIDGEEAYNDFIAPIIERYGYLEGGLRTGGGLVGADDEFNDQDYYRESYQGGFDYFLGERVVHELHVGYQWSRDEEDLLRGSNGWGFITVPGGRVSFEGQPIFYQADFLQAPAGSGSVIHSELESQSIEFNDTIRLANWTFNAGVVLSQDTFYGQGLRENSSNISGFEVAPGHQYEMYEIDWDEMIQPRLGATWAYNGRDTAYASVARYHPAANSLPRAAAWDRNAFGLIVEAYFDENGNFFGSEPRGSSSGKFFADDLDPRAIDEFLLGTSRQINNRLTGRAFARYRYGYNFWEDTNNNARVAFEPPPGIPQEDYIPNLADVRDEIGGSSYVIAELDGAFTKFYEVSLEGEWRGDKTFLRGSYVWSHYYGNFDQDNTNGDGFIANDFNTFIGSSNLADGAGRQIWDMKYGDLRGDRRHLLKVYGYYELEWNATAGAFAVYQDGQPWEAWDVEVYRHLTSSTSQTIRFAEPAGSRRSEDHYQLDLNYTHNFPFGDGYNVQLVADVFNITDNQTGFAIQPIVSHPDFGEPTRFFDPRRFQLAARFQF
jgi:hypothetical protein